MWCLSGSIVYSFMIFCEVLAQNHGFMYILGCGLLCMTCVLLGVPIFNIRIPTFYTFLPFLRLCLEVTMNKLSWIDISSFPFLLKMLHVFIKFCKHAAKFTIMYFYGDKSQYV